MITLLISITKLKQESTVLLEKLTVIYIHWKIYQGLMAELFVVYEFEFQSRYYIDFRTNTLRKTMNSLIPLSMGW